MAIFVKIDGIANQNPQNVHQGSDRRVASGRVESMESSGSRDIVDRVSLSDGLDKSSPKLAEGALASGIDKASPKLAEHSLEGDPDRPGGIDLQG